MAKHHTTGVRATVAVVGAGFCGTLTAIQLLRLAPAGTLQVLLFERRSRMARGLAYHTWDDNLLLNVPAGNMSALPDEPGHFVDYLRGVDPAFNAGSFVSRRIYGDYLEATLRRAEALHAGELLRITGEVVAVRPQAPGPAVHGRTAQGPGFAVSLGDGRVLEVDRAVLALGHFAPGDPPPAAALVGAPQYIANPWDFAAIDRADAELPVAVVGAGHTGVDVVFRLTQNGDSRKIYLLSRRGLLPHGHRFAPKPPQPAAGYPEYLRNLPPSLLAHVRAIRAEARKRLRAGDDWRDAINELRTHTPAIWQRLPTAERAKFLRRVVPFWDIHRHRLAPAAHWRLEQMLQSGQVESIAGQVQAYERDGARTVVIVRPRQGGPVRRLIVGAVVNCTGPNYDIASLRYPLLVQLREEGLIRQDALQLGFEVDAGYRVLGQRDAIPNGLFYIGPMLKARYWESIAVPELRVHAAKLAAGLLADLAPVGG
jgi:uncharacterized NAD(P)/FAD-binding protein YdhS